MKLSQEEVLKIANLARLQMTPEDAIHMAKQLSEILGYAEQLGELNIDGIEPTAHAMEVNTPFREDVIITSDVRDTCLKNSPDHEDTLFRVPKVL